MTKYKKRPITVQAYQLNIRDIYTIKKPRFEFVASWPKWFRDAVRDKVIYVNVNGIHIMTLEGSSYALTEGYWIVRGEQGELWPVRNNIFQIEYEKVKDA